MKNTPTIFVIFGATGDLVARKIAPSLYHLFKDKRLPSQFKVVGFARRDYNDADFRKHIQEAFLKHHAEKDIPTYFLELFSYHQGYFEQEDSYHSLAKRLQAIDEAWGLCTNKLFYLATPPESYESILTHTASAGLTVPCSDETGWTRVLLEKPFGNTLESAEKIDAILNTLFKEEQVYRIDHYLAKEMLQNIMTFRFSNNLLEDIWNYKFIERIDISILEKLDIEGRANFYDNTGALLDVGQNHLLQMLALVTMDHPTSISASDIRQERANVLQHIRSINADDIANQTFRAQYSGYLEEAGVRPHSQTETYFRVKTSLDLPRWQGVNIYLEAGKKMAEVKKEITVTFKHPAPCLCPSGKHYRNLLTFRIQPNPGISLLFWSKKPGDNSELEAKHLSFDYHQEAKELRYIEEYAKLILDTIAGDQTLFVSSSEALSGWRFIDPIIRAWHQDTVPLESYAQDEKVLEIAKKIDTSDTSTLKKDIAILGLGKMGKGLALRLIDQGWHVTGYNRTASVTKELENIKNFKAAYSYEEIVGDLTTPRIVWIMVPHSSFDDVVLGPEGIIHHLKRGDIIIDGGNSNYKDSIRRAQEIKKYGLEFLDVGVSGGPAGARNGPCLMIGGAVDIFKDLEPLFRDLTLPQGYAFFEGYGAGHFVKMIHNGIEYGMMQALAEGFAIMKSSKYDLDLTKVADIYNHGSVIESRLVGWLKSGFENYGQELADVSGSVAHTGEGEWTVKTADELGISTPVIKNSFDFRVQSVNQPSYIGKILSALRNQFGGHNIKK